MRRRRFTTGILPQDVAQGESQLTAHAEWTRILPRARAVWRKAEMSEEKTIHREVQEIWERNAAFWDEYMGEGGAFQRVLIGPTTDRLLDLKPGERVLDIACGNGAFARRMAALGARVVACDFAPTFIERAQARTTEHADRIEYRVIDTTDAAQLVALRKQSFDAAVCTMA